MMKESIEKKKVIFSDKAKKIKNQLFILINPFIYTNGRKPRLPRKRSNGYKLSEDTNSYFEYTFSEIEGYYSETKKYSVEITILKGNDRLGTGDLDNYSKAILDGITNSKKVWKDDEQVDKLLVVRKYSEELKSKISMKIEEYSF